MVGLEIDVNIMRVGTHPALYQRYRGDVIAWEIFLTEFHVRWDSSSLVSKFVVVT